MHTIFATDPRLTWSGTISLESDANSTKPWRIPHQDQDIYSPGVSELAGRAEMPSGVRVRFATAATELTFVCDAFAEDGNFDLVFDNEIIATTAFVAGDSEVRFADLPAGDKTLEIWLTPAMPVAMRHIA